MQSKLFLIIYIAATLILISSCNQIDPDPTPANTVELRKKSIEIIEADHIFAFELFNEIYKGSEKDNFMISPLR